jgi:hypothetical protein
VLSTQVGRYIIVHSLEVALRLALFGARSLFLCSPVVKALCHLVVANRGYLQAKTFTVRGTLGSFLFLRYLYLVFNGFVIVLFCVLVGYIFCRECTDVALRICIFFPIFCAGFWDEFEAYQITKSQIF